MINGKLIDISLALYDHFPMVVPAGFTKNLTFELEVLKEYDAPGGAGQIVRGVHMRLHAATHVDVPVHFVKGGTQLHDMPLEVFIGDAVVADVSDTPPNGPITPERLERALRGRLRRGDRLLVRTDWNKHYGELDWKERSPYLAPEAVDWCVTQGPVLVGCDFAQAKDAPESPCQEYTLRALLEHGIAVMAGLTNLDRVNRDRVTLIALPLSMLGVEASPVRAVVVEDEDGA